MSSATLDACDETFTIAQLRAPRLIISLAIIWLIMKQERKLTLRVMSKLSTSAVRNGWFSAMPALFTRKSTGSACSAARLHFYAH